MRLQTARVGVGPVFFLWSTCILWWMPASVEGANAWSAWFNSELSNGVDNQTLVRIRELFGYKCPNGNIVDAECRVKESTGVFAGTTLHDGVFLRVPCNGSGILCAREDQTFRDLAGECRDYEIRFLCQIEDSTVPQKTVENPLSVNGGFIAMAAGLSVVIPLICVLIIQLRRANREERERRRAAAAGGENGTAGPANDPPPSYEQLFGPEQTASSPIHSRNSSMDVLIEESEGEGSRGSGDNGGRSRGNVQNSRPPALVSPDSERGRNSGDATSQQAQEASDGSRSNPAFSTTSVSTISGSEVSDYPLTPSLSDNNPNEESTGETHHADSENSNVVHSIYPVHDSGSGQVITPRTQSHPTLSSAAPSSSTTALAPPPSPPPPPPSPPPSYPPPPFSSSSDQDSSNDESNNNVDQSRISQTLRRFPGMHISFEDFFSSLRALPALDNDGPPPSYEEALKILESAKQNARRKK